MNRSRIFPDFDTILSSTRVCRVSSVMCEAAIARLQKCRVISRVLHATRRNLPRGMRAQSARSVIRRQTSSDFLRFEVSTPCSIMGDTFVRQIVRHVISRRIAVSDFQYQRGPRVTRRVFNVTSRRRSSVIRTSVRARHVISPEPYRVRLSRREPSRGTLVMRSMRERD